MTDEINYSNAVEQPEAEPTEPEPEVTTSTQGLDAKMPEGTGSHEENCSVRGIP